MIHSYGHVFIYRYVFKILKWKSYHTDNCFFNYNIILHCVFILYASVKSYFFKNKFGDIFSELQCCMLF